MNKRKLIWYFRRVAYWIAFPIALCIIATIARFNGNFAHLTGFILTGTIIIYCIYLVTRGTSISPLIETEEHANYLLVSGITATIMLRTAYTANHHVHRMGIIGWGITGIILLIISYWIMFVERTESGKTWRKSLASATRWEIIGYIAFVVIVLSQYYVHFGTLWVLIPVSGKFKESNLS